MIAVRCRTAITLSCWLMSRGGEPVMRDPGRVLVADELLPLLAQAGQRGPHTVLLPARRLDQIANRSAVWPLEQGDDRGLLGRPRRCDRRAGLWSSGRSRLCNRPLRF